MTTTELGKCGEDAACAYLRRHGYAILARNERFGKSEIDAVCRQKNDLVFCEVKTRTAPPDIPSPYGTAAAAVNAEKQKHLIAAAKAYLRRFPQTSRIRFDVIEVYGKITKKRFFCKERERFSVQKINHIENAFMQTTTL